MQKYFFSRWLNWMRFWVVLELLLAFLVVTLISIFLANNWVENSTRSLIFNNVDSIPSNRVGLVLGTSKFLRNGRINPYYTFRIDAAVALYNSGKIQFILVSGDNSRESYDEPTTFKTDLIARGIPENKIYLDYAGFRTLDSVIRCNKVFGLSQMTIISQPFHNQRAICIARQKGIKAIGFNANEVGTPFGARTQIRERFARVKMVLDLLTLKGPKYLGEPIKIQ